MAYMSCAALVPLLLTLVVNAQSGTPPSSWPQVYPGIPTGDYGPEWQDCGSLVIFTHCLRANSAE